MLAKPLKIGVYGVSGIGKTTFLHSMKKYTEAIESVDGSVVMDQIIEGGLAGFKKKSFTDKTLCREQVIKELEKMFVKQNKHFMVSGHYSFLLNDGYEIAWTKMDAIFYDVIFILNKSAQAIYEQCQGDLTKIRYYSVKELEYWQYIEINGIQQACQKANIPCYILNANLSIMELEKQFIKHLSDCVINEVAQTIISTKNKQVVLCDCDGTLNRDDVLNFSESISMTQQIITSIFKKYHSYCFDAFFDVSQYIDFKVENIAIDSMLNKAKKELIINHAIKEKLDEFKKKSIPIVFISCGFPDGWSENSKIADYVVGGASFNFYGCIVTNEGKSLLAKILSKHKIKVTSFGNGLVDIGMLKNSHTAYYVYSNQPKENHLYLLNEHNKLNLFKLRES